MHRFSCIWTFWKPFDPIEHLRGITFFRLNFDTFLWTRPYICKISSTIGCPRFCQKLKIQKVTPLRFWIGSNGFQKVQKLENLCMLEGALTHIYVYEANSLKRIIRRRCFYLKIRLPLLQMTSTQKIIFKGSSNLQKNFGSKFWHQGPMISNNLYMAIFKLL